MGFQLTPLTTLVLGGPEQRSEASTKIQEALKASSGSMAGAARALGVSRATLYNYCGRLGVSLEEHAQGRYGQKGGEGR